MAVRMYLVLVALVILSNVSAKKSEEERKAEEANECYLTFRRQVYQAEVITDPEMKEFAHCCHIHAVTVCLQRVDRRYSEEMERQYQTSGKAATCAKYASRSCYEILD